MYYLQEYAVDILFFRGYLFLHSLYCISDYVVLRPLEKILSYCGPFPLINCANLHEAIDLKARSDGLVAHKMQNKGQTYGVPSFYTSTS